MGKRNNLRPKDFVHLHNHTQYSLLDGLTKLPDLFGRVKEFGMEAVAMTDHGTMSGVIDFYKTADEFNIKPIIGMETYVAARTHLDKDPAKDKNNFHLTILAMDNVGYQNLMKLSTVANLDGFYYRPRIDRELLKKYNQGLIVLSGCIGGEVGTALQQGQYDNAKKIASWYKEVFGDRYYLEVQDHGHKDHPSVWQEQVEVTNLTLKLGKELNIPCVLTCDAHYLKHEDKEAHEILLCVQTGSFLADTDRMSLDSFELYVSDPKDIIGRWGKDNPELITNSKVISDRCDVTIKLGEYRIPKFPVPKNETEKSYLDLLTYQGLIERYKPNTKPKGNVAQLKKQLPKDIVERAEYELGVIDGMGFNGYFLIVQDFINWGKNKGIVFGPGRGSGAGSIVAYGLRITELDPLEYDLLFERFLNPDRISMPDFDIDIQDTRRDEVIQYCVDKYGVDRVANIVTFGRMAARNSVRDVARVLQVPYAEADRLAKMIPAPIQGRHIPLERAIKENMELSNEYRTNETAKKVFDLAKQLEGTIRSHGVHAAGVVIAPDDIVKYVPLEKAQKGVIATQYSMGPIEDLGLLKMDFLGLSNLTIIKNTLRIIKRVYGNDIDINDISLNDKKTYELLARGDTTGVFQLESAGMKRYLKELKPTVFEDIISMVALYRPGPMQWIDDFIARKHGLRKIEYLHSAMKPALESTYGVIVTQEQVMQISKEMCGFSGGQADTLRKAIGKKIPEVMKKMKSEFIEGAIKTVGANRQLMEKFWKQLEDFAAYCFNKAHSACYAMIAYQTAYLKAHYPAAFMAALMTSDYDDTDRLAIEINECQHMGIEVLPPDINQSFLEFAVVPGEKKIRFGLNAIKNVGTGAVEEILRSREEQGGTFKTIEDFFGGLRPGIINRKTIESLIKCGAFDSFEDRSKLMANIDVLLAYASKLQKESSNGQVDMFADGDESHAKAQLILDEPLQQVPMGEQLQWERELLGLYLSQHPLHAYEGILSEKTITIDSLKPEYVNKTVSVGGHIIESREITTKNGQKMAFVRIADKTGDIEVVLFPSIHQQTIGMWQKDNVVIVKGKLSNRDNNGGSGELKVLADDARAVTHEQAEAYQPTGKKVKTPRITSSTKQAMNSLYNPKLYIRIRNSEDHNTLIQLKSIIDNEPGNNEVVLVVGKDASKQALRLPGGFNIKSEALSSLKELVGPANIVTK